MGERKVLNKYFPPDFDPAAIPRCSIKRDRQYKVRLMAPFNMRCKSCGNYIYKGTKFNAIKETAKGEEYLGMLIFRFYIRCTACSAEITFKTDPKNTDYVCEIGATRNFEEWRMKDRIGTIDDEIAAEEEEKEEVNPMKALEERTKESKAEMDMIDALEDLKDANARSSKVSVDSVIASKVEQGQAHIRALAAKINADEDAAVAKHFSKQEGPVIKRLDDEVKPEPTSDASMQSAFGAPKAKKIKSLATSDKSTGSFGGMKKLGSLVKRKQLVKPAETAKEKVLPAKPAGLGLGLVGDYSSDSD